MPLSTSSSIYICSHCMRPRRLAPILRNAQAHSILRPLSTASPNNDQPKEHADDREKEQGAMSRRLAELSEEGLETGGRSARKAIQEAGFDEDLKRRLEERIAGAGFRNENAAAIAQAELPASAGRHTRDIAGATPWSGTESIHDASLRMLNDSHKPIRTSPKPGAIRGPPRKVDTGRPKSSPSSGARLANARDKTSAYAYMKDLSDEERERFRKEMKERFTPSARSLPMTIKGLESLANERIENAIAKGQFRNLPRGKVIERDYNASSPFIDSTEYLLNRMIQRQDIVPPWIEKQQEIISSANRFRGRLRADWRRHVARSIASRGGPLESQMQLADQYAQAEAIENPRPVKKTEKLNSVDEAGHLSQITLAGELKPSENASSEGQPEQITVTERPVDDSGDTVGPKREMKISVEPASSETTTPAPPKQRPTVAPFRDEKWLQTERSYHQVAIENLNSLTRSYNLMCPALAQRPYFSLDRELKACYAEVAPQVAATIKERTTASKLRVESVTSKPVSLLANLGGPQARVYDNQAPKFGFRELWKEWFRKD